MLEKGDLVRIRKFGFEFWIVFVKESDHLFIGKVKTDDIPGLRFNDFIRFKVSDVVG